MVEWGGQNTLRRQLVKQLLAHSKRLGSAIPDRLDHFSSECVPRDGPDLRWRFPPEAGRLKHVIRSVTHPWMTLPATCSSEIPSCRIPYPVVSFWPLPSLVLCCQRHCMGPNRPVIRQASLSNRSEPSRWLTQLTCWFAAVGRPVSLRQSVPRGQGPQYGCSKHMAAWGASGPAVCSRT